MTNELVDLSTLPQDMQDYLAELDKKSVSKGTGMIIPELKIVSSIKVSEELRLSPGTFYTISKAKEGENKICSPKGKEVNVIVLSMKNQYNIFDETIGKPSHETTEFEGFEEELEATDLMTNHVFFRGNAKEFKQYALKNFPGTKENSHLFKYRFVFYVLIPSEIEEKGLAGSVYRLYTSVSSMDNIRAYEKSLNGTPIRYITQLSNEPKDFGTNRAYLLILKKIAENATHDLVTFLGAKKALEDALKGFKASKPIVETAEEDTKVYEDDGVRPTHQIPETTTVLPNTTIPAGLPDSVKEAIAQTPTEIVDTPITTPTFAQQAAVAGVSQEEVNSIFG